MLKIALNGATGRVGKTIVDLAPKFGAEIIPVIRGENPLDAIHHAGAGIDFSLADATLPFAQACADRSIPLVIGTTGHDPSTIAATQALAKKIPILWAQNFSIGMNLMFYISKLLGPSIPESYDSELIELHHKHKKDKPSGTAKQVAAYLGKDPSSIHALRAGDKASEHTLFLTGPGEYLKITHRAEDRSVFATGALTSAHWLLDKPAGLYSMLDVLNLKLP